MRAFFEKIDAAVNAKTPGDAIGKLTEAFVIYTKLLDQARARCELRTAEDLTTILRWAASKCAHRADPKGPAPFPWPFLGGSVWGGRVTRNPSSLDFRWHARADMPETWLPSVPIWTRGAEVSRLGS